MATIQRKVSPNEIIEIGDVLMISPDNQCVSRAYKDEEGINERLVIGVCTGSDNTIPKPIRFIGGDSSVKEPNKTVLINGGNSIISVIPLNFGSSEERPREVVIIETSGKQIVNVTHYPDVGDSLTLSRLHKGKAEAVDILNSNRFSSRTFAKVIKHTKNKEQVLCLLDIE